MSNIKNCRSYNVSPILVGDCHSNILGPSSKPNINVPNAFTARAKSPRLARKSLKTTRASPVLSSSNLVSRLELTEKQNLMLNERNKVLVKEKVLLQKKLTKETQDPKSIFKSQAVALTKESYLKRIEKENSRKLSDFEEKIPQIRKILHWINEQSPDKEIKFIKTGITEVIEKLKGLEIEIEAYRACMLKHSDKQVKELEKKIEDLNQKQNEENADTLTMLIKKNNDLCRVNCSLEKKVEEQNKKINSQSSEISNLKKHELSNSFLEEIKKGIEMQVVMSKKQEDEEVAIALKLLEKEHLKIKDQLNQLQIELHQKSGWVILYNEDGCVKQIFYPTKNPEDQKLGDLIKNLSSLKNKNKELKLKLQSKKFHYKELKRKYEKKVQMDLVNKEITQKFQKTPSEPQKSYNDFLSYTTCMAAALEDFLY